MRAFPRSCGSSNLESQGAFRFKMKAIDWVKCCIGARVDIAIQVQLQLTIIRSPLSHRGNKEQQLVSRPSESVTSYSRISGTPGFLSRDVFNGI